MATPIAVKGPSSAARRHAQLELPRAAERARRQRRVLLALNALGGIAVLGSYAWGLSSRADAGAALWGGVPDGLRPLYTTSMLLAAVGYFPMTGAVLVGLDPARARVGHFGYGVFSVLYALILIPSALWLPLTLWLVEGPFSASLWLGIRGVLALVGLGSLGLLAALVRVSPGPRPWLRALALAGASVFCFQTVLLDALLWPAFFLR